MSDKPVVGRIEFGPELTPYELGRELVLRSGLPEIIANMRTMIVHEAEQLQMERDCAALCDACKRGVTVERVIGGIWSHREQPHYNTVTCAAHPLRVAWAERQAEVKGATDGH